MPSSRSQWTLFMIAFLYIWFFVFYLFYFCWKFPHENCIPHVCHHKDKEPLWVFFFVFCFLSCLFSCKHHLINDTSWNWQWALVCSLCLFWGRVCQIKSDSNELWITFSDNHNKYGWGGQSTHTSRKKRPETQSETKYYQRNAHTHTHTWVYNL